MEPKISLEPGRSEILHEGPLDHRVDATIPSLNTASEAEIAQVDFVSHTLAKAIVALRSELGAFESWEQLRRVEGLKANKIAELQRKFRLGSAPHG